MHHSRGKSSISSISSEYTWDSQASLFAFAVCYVTLSGFLLTPIHRIGSQRRHFQTHRETHLLVLLTGASVMSLAISRVSMDTFPTPSPHPPPHTPCPPPPTLQFTFQPHPLPQTLLFSTPHPLFTTSLPPLIEVYPFRTVSPTESRHSRDPFRIRDLLRSPQHVQTFSSQEVPRHRLQPQLCEHPPRHLNPNYPPSVGSFRRGIGETRKNSCPMCKESTYSQLQLMKLLTLLLPSLLTRIAYRVRLRLATLFMICNQFILTPTIDPILIHRSTLPD